MSTKGDSMAKGTQHRVVNISSGQGDGIDTLKSVLHVNDTEN